MKFNYLKLTGPLNTYLLIYTDYKDKFVSTSVNCPVVNYELFQLKFGETVKEPFANTDSISINPLFDVEVKTLVSLTQKLWLRISSEYGTPFDLPLDITIYEPPVNLNTLKETLNQPPFLSSPPASVSYLLND